MKPDHASQTMNSLLIIGYLNLKIEAHFYRSAIGIIPNLVAELID